MALEIQWQKFIIRKTSGCHKMGIFHLSRSFSNQVVSHCVIPSEAFRLFLINRRLFSTQAYFVGKYPLSEQYSHNTRVFLFIIQGTLPSVISLARVVKGFVNNGKNLHENRFKLLYILIAIS